MSLIFHNSANSSSFSDLSDDRFKRFPWESAVLIAGSTAFCLSLVFVIGYFILIRTRLCSRKSGSPSSDLIPAAIRVRIDKIVSSEDSGENGSHHVAQSVLQNNLWATEPTIKQSWSSGEKLCNLWRCGPAGVPEFSNELRDWGSREKVPSKTSWSTPIREAKKSDGDGNNQEIVVDHIVTVWTRQPTHPWPLVLLFCM